MTEITQKQTEEMYKFRRKKFLCDKNTIQILNNALSMNGVADRYIKIK